MTINGCIRVLSHPSYPTVRATFADVIAHLRIFCARPNHEFWSDDISLLDEARCRPSKIASSSQLTDIYLLALAVSRKGKLVTFDRGISIDVVPGSGAFNLELLALD